MCGFVAFLSGCGGNELDDLKEYVAEVKSRKQTSLEQLPEIRPSETFLYSSNERRDPFVASVQTEDTEIIDENGPHPDFKRRKQELESYSLDSLRMVGTMRLSNIMWALIKAPGGTVHRVHVDNYMGQNHGQIISINENQIDLVEIIPNGYGGWKENQSQLVLSE
ncbi:MAG: pilus assembly protein PilP [Methylococcales bacterium]|nr:pilus assembly protein PilP [Methylococcales bacterium]MBT7410977.1 pilus assembly protein PilP [Methylococcales bacterium]